MAQRDQCVGPEMRVHPCAVLPRAKEDNRGVGSLQRVDLLNGTCFWMDRTEVTVEAYRRWLEGQASSDVDWNKEHCDWKRARTELLAGDPGAACDAPLSTRDHDPFADRKPVRCIDFCDAEAFCGWAGKRLCNEDLNSGNAKPRNVHRQWSLACSNGSTTAYPWGDDAADGTCRVLDEDAEECVTFDSVCGPGAVGDSRDCATRSGVLDLLGSVAEWAGSCANGPPDAGLPRGCLALGGSFEQPLQSCVLQRVERGDARLRDVGFRCCAALSQTETVQVEEARGEP